MSKIIDKIAQIKHDNTLLCIKIKSYNEETGRILGTKVAGRTIGDPNGVTNQLVISHKDQIIGWQN